MLELIMEANAMGRDQYAPKAEYILSAIYYKPLNI